ncbi:MAG: hypothetical protein WEE51_00575 [Pirellulaceae bacterium]
MTLTTLPRPRLTIRLMVGILSLAFWGLQDRSSEAANAVYELKVVDAETGLPRSARIQVKDSRDRVRKVRGALNLDGFAYFTGGIVLELAPGSYKFHLDAGLEYPFQDGFFELQSGDQDTGTIELKRFTDLRKKGWWAGDLAIQHRLADAQTMMMADDLHVAVLQAWDNKLNPFAGQPIRETHSHFDTDRHLWLLGGEDRRAGGTLWFANLPQPLPITRLDAEFPSPLAFQNDIREVAAAHIAADPLSPDLPIWIAHDLVDSLTLLAPADDKLEDSHPLREQFDPLKFPGTKDVTRMRAEVYFHLLNCGLRIAPSAVSLNGREGGRSDYARVYVQSGEELDYAKWWKDLEQGKSFVTNGPLLRTNVEGHPPGYTFQMTPGKPLTLQAGLTLSTRDKISYLELIQNGKKVEEVSLAEYKAGRGVLPPFIFEEPGWFLIRVVTENPDNYQFAINAPYFVEANGVRRVSRESVEFFQKWLYQRSGNIALEDGPKRDQIIDQHREGRDFWRKLHSRANAD